MKIENQNLRGEWTSASAASYDKLCPGRHLAQRGIAEESQSEDAAAGTRIHAYLAGSRTLDMEDAGEQDTADKCVLIETMLLERFVEGGAKIIREQRLWLEVHHDGIQPLKHSGQPDVVAILGDEAAVIDTKTGRNEVQESPTNAQLRDLAVLVAVNFGVKKVSVAINQPWATFKPEVCVYELEDLMRAKSEIDTRVIASNDPASPRVPGFVQCQYCRAKSKCPEFMASSVPMQLEQALAPEMTPESSKAALSVAIQGLNAERLGKFLPLVKLAAETAEAEVRRRLADGIAVDGYALKDGRTTHPIKNVPLVFQRAVAAGISQEAFIAGCITVGKEKLKAALKTATGSKGQALDQHVEQLLEGATEEKTSAPILTRV